MGSSLLLPLLGMLIKEDVVSTQATPYFCPILNVCPDLSYLTISDILEVTG